jgi:DNA polymerase III alpha subunit
VTKFACLEDFAEDASLSIFKSLLIAGFFDPLGSPWEVAEEYYSMRNEEVPFEYDHSDLFVWAKMKQEAYGFQVESWKSIAPFNKGVAAYTMADLALIDDGDSVLLGGIVERVQIERTAKGEKYASILIVDRNEKYFIKIWPDIWQNERLSRERRRPSVGDVIEIYAKKNTYKGKPSLVMKSIDSPLRIVWKAE